MYFGRSGDCPRDADALPHAARQFGGISKLDVRQIDEVERFVNAILDFAVGELLLFAQAHRDVLADGERVEQRGELKDVTDARAKFVELAARELGHLEIVDLDTAGIGLEESDDMLDRDGFSRCRNIR
jgi:hypothetical protein